MTDQDFSSAYGSDTVADAAHQSVSSATPSAVVSATMQPAVNVAFWQNHVPVLTELTVTANSAEALGDITIDLACEPPVIGPRSWHLQGVTEGQVRVLDELDLTLDGKMLANLTEGTRAVASFAARRRGDTCVLTECHCDIRVLTRNEWGGSGGIPDILAAFVEPNDPAIATLLRVTSDHLRMAGKPDGLEGYQAASKARIWEQVEALWRAVGSLDIRYVNPAPSFEKVGQKIRPPSQLLSEKLATCLDLAVLFAAAIEAIGLRPVIVLVRDHAFAGFWLTRHDFGSSVADDAPSLRNRLALHDLILFETTLICGRGRTGFKRACEAGEAHVSPDKDAAFEAVIDIQRARQRRIRPLSSNSEEYSFNLGAPEAPDGAVELPHDEPPSLREDPDDQVETTPTTPESRLERWRKRLLDLTGRNRLLNLQISGKQALPIDCPDAARLENMLADMRGRAKPQAIKFRPWPDLMSGSDPRSAKIHRQRLQEDADRAFATEALDKRELVVGRDDNTLQATLTEIYRNARAAQQEGGTNTLFLTIGALLWRQTGKEHIYRAPIILVPVVLERPSVRSGFSLRVHDDDTRLNATLLEMLKQEFDIRLPTLEGDRAPTDASGLDVEHILSTFRAKLRDIPGWEVTNDVALTNLSFTKYLMWKDLSDRANILRESELARRLMDGQGPHAAAGQVSKDEIREGRHKGGELDDVAGDLVCPLEADSSQLQAVALARAGTSYVMIGPPGTGKSQTIANIIADTLSQGRTVLFVAEKRAALEVVQRRLKSIGLGDFCLDLFSAKSSKAQVLEQMGQAQQAHEDFDATEWHNASRDVSALRSELNQYVRELHKRGRNGWTPFRAMGCVLRAEGGGIPDVNLSWPDADIHDSGDYQRLIETIEDASAVLVRVGDITAAALLSGVEMSEWSPPWQVRLLEAVRTTSARLKSLSLAAVAARKALALTEVDNSRSALLALRSLAALVLDPIAADAVWATRDGADVLIEAVRAEAKRTNRYNEIRAALTGAWKPEAMALPLKDIQAQWTASEASWFAAKALDQRRIRRRLTEAAARDLPTDLKAELVRLVEMQAIEAEISAADRLSPALSPHWKGLDTDFSRIESHYDWARRLRGGAATCAKDTTSLLALREHLKQLIGEGADLLAPEATVGAALTQLRTAWNELEASFETLGGLCGTDPVAIADGAAADWVEALATHLDNWITGARHLRDWCAWRGVVQRGLALGIGDILRAMEDGLVAPSDAPRVFEANYARWWVGLAVDASTRLKGFVAARHEKQIERFRALDKRLLELASHLTRAKLAAAIPGKTQRERDPEYLILSRELAKRQRHLPVRQLAERMPNALRRLMPCLMMSPLSVAQYLPADAKPFNLVIFDEASQIPTWDAIGVIGRGRQVVVVGDPRQLPPTRFFERQVPGSDGDTVEVETEDLESILDECIGAGISSVELKWHYRSRHESLIAFSNQTYYGGRLVTFPAPVTADKAVAFRHIPHGVYARAGARTNHAEALAVTGEVVAMLSGMLNGEPRRSIGIVTFNAEQQSLIENLLDNARLQDPRLEPFFSEEDEAEPVLIKNLESVQGEERDIMMFSLTYGPDQTGRVAMNFGPLNQAGGERRLNVAITRAREALIVFGSLRSEHIDLSRTSAIGVAHLKQFLDFAIHGARAFARAATGPLGDHESPFEAAVAERLSAKGWVLQPQIGVSGFRIDLGVVDPDAPGAFLAGIECDGATYHRGATARDRDRLRQVVLEGLGWRIMRIWSTDWWTNAARECDRLHLALVEALVAKREQTASPQPGEPATVVGGEEEITHNKEISDPVAASFDTTPAGTAPATTDDDVRPDATRFYDDDYRATLRTIVLAEVAKWGPIRVDRLAQKIARLHGFQRTGREIQERVSDSIDKSCVQTKEDLGAFVWPMAVDPSTWDVFRHQVGDESRDPSEIPMEELVALARKCLSIHHDQDAVLLAMRDACGVQKLREASRERFLEAIRRV